MTQTDVSHETAAPRGAETRTRILDAAIRLFAVHGVANTSLRQITAEAQVNLAAINYHFQSKEQLVTAVMRRLIDPINERRLQILTALEDTARDKPVKLEAILRAFLQPIFEARDNDPLARLIPRLYGRLHAEPGDLVSRTFLPVIAPVIARFLPALRRAVPGLNETEIGWCMFFTMGATINSLISAQTLAALIRDDTVFESWPDILERLIPFCAAGIRAAARAKAAKGAD